MFSAQLVLHTALRQDLVPGGYYEDEELEEIGSYTQSEKDAVYNEVSSKVKALRGKILI